MSSQTSSNDFVVSRPQVQIFGPNRKMKREAMRNSKKKVPKPRRKLLKMKCDFCEYEIQCDSRKYAKKLKIIRQHIRTLHPQRP